MKIVYILILMVAFLQAIIPACPQPDGINNFPYLGQTPPGETPQVFAPGIVSTEHLELGSPAISPDGAEIYWSRIELPLEENISKIMYVKNENGIWSEPEVASFSGFYPDDAPLFSRDGNKLFFTSEREFIVWRIRGHKESGWERITSVEIHVVNRFQDDWTVPACLTTPKSYNSRSGKTRWDDNPNVCYLPLYSGNEWDGLVYKKNNLNNNLLNSSILPAIKNSQSNNFTPCIAKDDSYIIFSSTRNPYREDYGDLYICFRQWGDKWSDAIFMGEAINTPAQERSPSVSPDGKYLFFTRLTRENDQDIYWVDAKIIAEIKKENNLE